MRLFAVLGQLAVRHPKTIILAWVLVLGAAAAPAAGLSERFLYDEGSSSAFTESKRAADLLAAEFPGRSANGTAIVVLRAANGFDGSAGDGARAVARAVHGAAIPDALSTADAWIATAQGSSDPYARSWEDVRGGAPPGSLAAFASPRGDVMLVTVTLAHKSGERGPDGTFYSSVATRALRAAVGAVALPEGVAAYVTGDAALAADQRAAAHAPWEFFVTLALALLLIGVFFRSVAAPFVPIGMLAAATGLTQGILFFVASAWGGFQYNAYSLLTSVLLGAGADYAIFMVARFREERALGLARDDAIMATVRTAGESITTSGFAVIVSFGALALGSFQIVQQMGIAVAIGIFVVLALGLTLLPAILRLAGDRVFWPSHRPAPPRARDRPGYYERGARWATRRPWLVVGAALVVTVPAVWVLASTPVSFDFLEAAPAGEAREGYDAVRAAFGEGSVLPTVVAVQLARPLFGPDGTVDREAWDAIEAITQALASDPRVAHVEGPTRPGGAAVAPSGSLAATRAYVGTSGTVVLLRVTLASTPYSDAALSAVPELRERLDAARAGHAAVSGALMGGATAALRETRDAIARDTRVMLSVVFALMFVILFVALRSLVVPLRAIVTILLSIAWSLAITALVFHDALGHGILWIAPLVTFVMLFGLGMDYDIFLVTAVREEKDRGRGDAEAIARAMKRTGGIITLAGIVMGGAFYGLALNDNLLLHEMGFALGTGVLLDALVVRTYLVPAILMLGARWNWWLPKWLRGMERSSGS